MRRLLDTLDKGFVAQFLALAAWNAPDSGTPEGRRRQLEYLDSGIAAARPDVQLDRLLLVSAHAQRGAVQAQAGDVVAAKEAVARRSRVPRSMKPCTPSAPCAGDTVGERVPADSGGRPASSGAHPAR